MGRIMWHNTSQEPSQFSIMQLPAEIGKYLGS